MRTGSQVIDELDQNRRGVVIASRESEQEYDEVDVVDVRWESGQISRNVDPSRLHDVTPMVYANLYVVDRVYGGPEEGGWTYDRYSPYEPDDNDIETDEPPSSGLQPGEDAALIAMERLEKWCDQENSSRRPLHSVLSTGIYRCLLEAWPAEISPRHRPHYC